MTVTHVVGARPNFMKAAPVMQAIATTGLVQAMVHTGQHYDDVMSGRLFRQLGLRDPDVNLNVGSGTHAQQTAAAMVGLEAFLIERPSSMLVVYGDVNSTAAAALVGAKLGIRVAHVEAGVRSGDRSMPEEVNRLVTDTLANLLFTPSADADENLRREGAAAGSIHRVGNVMIDSLVRCLPLANADEVLKSIGLSPTDPYILVTLHRPATVDAGVLLEDLLGALGELAQDVPVVFPVHPRTRTRISSGRPPASRVHLIDPVGYLEFLALQRGARLVITDSGGVQTETTFMKVACLTVRDNTEWPVTMTHGTNQLVGRDPARLLAAARKSLEVRPTLKDPPELWDGHASDRIAAIVANELH